LLLYRQLPITLEPVSMTTKVITEVTRVAAGDDRVHYDAVEMALHWTTAVLVITLYLLAQAWGFLDRGPLRHALQSLHVSLGLLLAATLLARILWRVGPGRSLPPATTGLVELAAKTSHYALYTLLVAVVGLGLCFRWAQGEPLAFFGLFALSAPYPFVKEQAQTLGDLHYWVATTIIMLAGLHAAAALFHHYVLRDDVLWRMLPGLRAKRAEAATPDPRTVAKKS
jgi:cytochrome b561